MALGDGCWGPGIHWDAENAAAFTGPRAGAWPYSGGCTVSARNGLFIDPNIGGMYTLPPMGVNALAGSWNQSTAGASWPAGYILAPTTSNDLLVSSAYPSVQPPAYSCPVPGCHDQQVLTLDLTIGTGSYVNALSYDFAVPNGYNTEFVNKNPPVAVGTNAKANLGANALTFRTTQSTNDFTDDPYGYTPAFTGSWGLIPSQTDWASVDPWTPPSTNYTIMAWVKPRVLVATGRYSVAGAVLSLGGTNASMVTFGQTPGNAGQWTMSNCTSDVASPTVAATDFNTQTLGAWQHVAIIVGTSIVTTYVNGVAANTSSITKWTPNRLTIGAVAPGGSGPTNLFDGQIANVMVYASVLTQSQIQQCINTPLTPTAGATNWWPLNDPSNPQRIIKTITLPRAYAYAGTSPRARWRIDVPATATGSVVNAWSLQLSSAFYAPNLAAAV